MFNDTAQLMTVYPENPFYNFFVFSLRQFKITTLAIYQGTKIFTDELIEKYVGKKGLEEIQKILAENTLSEKKFKNLNQTSYIRQTINISSWKSLSPSSLFGKKISAKQLSSKLMIAVGQENLEHKTFVIDELKPSIRCFALLLTQIRQYNSGMQIKNIDAIETIMHGVAKYGNSFILKSFLKDLDVAALINRQNPKGLTHLHYACRYNDSSVVEFLLDNKADIEIRDKKGERAINFASRNKDPNVVSVLLAKDAKKYLNSPDNLNPLISAVIHDGDHYPATIWKLAEAGAVLSTIDKKCYEEESAEVSFFLAIREIKNNDSKSAEQHCQESKELSSDMFKGLVDKTCQLWAQNINYLQLSVSQFEEFQKITSYHEQTKSLI